MKIRRRRRQWSARSRTASRRPLSLAIRRTPVAGRVSFGGRPTAATLAFIDPFGARRVAMETAADGSFAGPLPLLSTGDWTNAWVRIENRNSAKVLDVANCGTGDGANVQQWTWLSDNCQQWQLQQP
jgi:hypothetical protein